MADMKKIEIAEVMDSGLQSESSTKLAKQNVTSGKDRTPSDLAASNTTQVLTAEQGVYYPSNYSYYYAGYNGTPTQYDNGGYIQADGSYAGVQPSDNGQMLYYMQSYNPYATGNHMGADKQFVGQQPYTSSPGYAHHSGSYGSDVVPRYLWDSSFVGDSPKGTAAHSRNTKYGPGHTSLAKSNGMYSMKTNGSYAPKSSALGSKSHQAAASASSNFSKSFIPSQPLTSLNKMSHLGSGLPDGAARFQSAGKFSSILHNGAMNYKQSSRAWNGNDRIRLGEKFNGNGEFEPASELTCGPRANNSATVNVSGEKEELGFAVRRDQYNLQDFVTDYDSAKFYVVKSYNEDNIHRCVKYGVWSSTPNGNKKLDAIYRNAESKSIETGKKCPIFLFFSVNGSGQFVGLAEMIGPVDFNKDMDFWQLDRWSGFFPVKWHIIKDVPNTQLRHIILENNDNKPVTYTRDTQEVYLKQGLEMLNIFKNYSEKMSILDDFRFYETREKSNISKKTTKPISADEFANQFKAAAAAGEIKLQEANSPLKNQISDVTSTLIGLTRNLSLNDRLSKNGGALHLMRESGRAPEGHSY